MSEVEWDRRAHDARCSSSSKSNDELYELRAQSEDSVGR